MSTRAIPSLAGFCASVCMYALQVLLPNYPFVVAISTSSILSLTEKLYILFFMIVAPIAVLGTFGTVLAACLAVLVGLTVYYVVQLHSLPKTCGTNKAAGAGGVLAGILGTGCTSCGVVILSLVLPFSAALSVVAWLPFDGRELVFVALVLLARGVYRLRAAVYAVKESYRNDIGGEQLI